MLSRISKLSALLLAVLVMVMVSACTTPAVVGGQDRNFRTINVNGTGIVYGSPDIANADISVVTRNVEVKPATDENTRLMAAVLSALKALGVEDKDIRTSNYSIVIDQQVQPDGTLSETREYVITNTVTVTFRDLSKVGEALEAVITAGANQVNNIAFSLENTSELSSQAREKAMTDARTRADQLAAAAGVDIDVPYSVSESFSYIPLASRLDVGIGGGASPELAQSVPVQSGQIMVQVDVNVTYLIR